MERKNQTGLALIKIWTQVADIKSYNNDLCFSCIYFWRYKLLLIVCDFMEGADWIINAELLENS